MWKRPFVVADVLCDMLILPRAMLAQSPDTSTRVCSNRERWFADRPAQTPVAILHHRRRDGRAGHRGLP
jgi:hypothetical protein